MASGIDTVIFDMDGVIFDSEILVLKRGKKWQNVMESQELRRHVMSVWEQTVL